MLLHAKRFSSLRGIEKDSSLHLAQRVAPRREVKEVLPCVGNLVVDGILWRWKDFLGHGDRLDTME